MKTLTIAGMASVLLASSITVARSGSGGTTGGGDYHLGIAALLPKTLKIRVLYKMPRGMQSYGGYKVGTRRCWGLVPCPVYADHLSVEIDFDQARMQVKPGGLADLELDSAVGATTYGVFYRQFAPIPELQPTVGASDCNTSAVVKRSQLNLGSEVALKGMALAERLCMFSPNLDPGEGVAEQSAIEWDGQSINVFELAYRVKAIGDALMNQLDVESMASIHDLGAYSEFAMWASYGGLMDAVSSKIYEAEKNEGEEILGLAKKSVTAAGTCDTEAYGQLRAKLRNWKIGTSAYLDSLMSDGGMRLSPEFRSQLRSYRSTVNDQILGSVMPVCDQSRAGRIDSDGGLILR